MDRYTIAEAASRAGVGVGEFRHLVELGIITPGVDDRFRPGDLRRVGMVRGLVAAGIPLDGLADLIRSGQFSLDFLDAAAFERLSAFSDITFARFAERSGVPVEPLLSIREAAGSSRPRPDDLMRDEELPYAEFMAAQVRAGFRDASIQQLMRAQADSLRRMAETESAWWVSEVVRPAMEAGKRPDEIHGREFGDQMSVLAEAAILGMYHLRQGQVWTATIIDGIETSLAAAGVHSRLEHPPAMCFLDMTGYTQLTQERGDAAAARLAEELGQIVQRSSVKYGGRAVKWLGDGVMLFFPNPGQGVESALDMTAGVVAAGLPPAHVGLHAGPVIFQEGDYYGQTVNLAARIADYARPGEVLVSQALVDAATGTAAVFREIGPVELKGVAGSTRLHAASLPG